MHHTFIGENIRFLDVIIFIVHKGIQGAVDGIILAGFDFDGHGREAVVIVDQEIDFAFAAVVVIEQFISMSDELTGDHRFINGAQVHAPFVIQHGADVAAVQDAAQDAHVVQVQFQQVLAR